MLPTGGSARLAEARAPFVDTKVRSSMKLRLLALSAALALSVSACGSAESSSGDDKTEATATPTATEAPTDAAPTETTATSEAPADGAEASGDVTKPGTELGIGEWATLPFKSGDKQGVIKVRVVKVDKGSQADFKVFDEANRAKLKGYDPRYVRFEIAQVSDASLEFSSVSGLAAITANGDEAQKLTAFGNFEPCSSGSFPSGSKPGTTYESCVIGLVPGGGDDVVGGQFAAYDSDYASYGGKPVLWK